MLLFNMKNYLKEQFIKIYQTEPKVFLSCGGRFEVLGNHTDHNHGLCIAATCNLSIYCAVSKRDDLIVNAYSEGYGSFSLDLNNLDIVEEEKGRPVSLIRGISSYLSKEYNYGGFDIYIKSNVPSGAGVSSSAAFELLIAQTINVLFNEEKVPLMTLCKAAQFAERTYYGKMCGLLDQIGVAYGGLVYIDFKDIENPYVLPLRMNLDNYQFVIVNSGGSHAGLDHLYKAIPEDMFKIANCFGKQYLRDVDYELVKIEKNNLIAKCGQSAYDRAIHFYEESKRVETAITAIKNNDINTLITAINESRLSSTSLLKNMCVEDKVQDSPLEACELILKASHGKAGVKINGGGFAGSVIALVPNDELDNVVKAAKDRYGENNIHLVNVRNDKPSILK